MVVAGYVVKGRFRLEGGSSRIEKVFLNGGLDS